MQELGLRYSHDELPGPHNDEGITSPGEQRSCILHLICMQLTLPLVYLSGVV